MISYEEMRYLTAFAKIGTLSEVAEQFHISQPTITRGMKKIETDFGVPLFERTKNSIRLNDSGLLAAEEAAIAIKQMEEMLLRVRAYDQAKHTLSIGSSAAVQLPELFRRISSTFPDMTVSTQLKKPVELMKGLENDTYQLVILPYEPEESGLVYSVIGKEHLMFCLPKKHRFAKRKTLTMAEMNGENMLLFSEIGFWQDIVREKMPDSRFLIQNERYSLEELVANSVLPCFTTDLARWETGTTDGRVCVPISDSEVNVTYYLICKKENEKNFSALFLKK